jgi:preprotein translocase subunit YajC
MLQALKKGDQVITRGGLIGRVSGVKDDELIIELQEKVRVRVMRSHVEGKYTPRATADDKNDSTQKAA